MSDSSRLHASKAGILLLLSALVLFAVGCGKKVPPQIQRIRSISQATPAR